MKQFIRIIAYVRSFVLRNDLKKVKRTLVGLTHMQQRQLAHLLMKEFAEAGKLNDSIAYANSQSLYAPWGDGTRLAMERMRSNNDQLRMRGVALWIVVAFNETRQTPHAELAEVHRSLIRLSRDLKSALPQQQASLQAA